MRGLHTAWGLLIHEEGWWSDKGPRVRLLVGIQAGCGGMLGGKMPGVLRELRIHDSLCLEKYGC